MYFKNAWEKYVDQKELMEFCEDYKEFISKSKTERLFTKNSIELAKKAGFKDINDFKKLKKGDKVYVVNRDKNVCLFLIGEESLTKGINVLGAHIDSPRMDLKQNPVYEKDGFCYFDTHYYGGIKTYQWVTIPLSLIGVVIKKDGTKIEVNIGEDEKDPILYISDLLIHLAKDQLSKRANEVVLGENLDLLIGSIPSLKAKKEVVKENILNILKEKYKISEEDFVSSELEVVPSFKARDLGLDRSLVAAYGQDDKVCAYTSLRAILDTKEVKKTACTILVDKEEIGSMGATGAQSRFFENVIAKLISLKEDNYNDLLLRECLTNSNVLSSDVSAGSDPLYNQVDSPRNNCYLGKGIVFNKYTGSRGKGGCNDANAEYIAKIRNIMDKNKIYYQTSELGKVDQGGGGTIAYILANLNMNVIDAGVGVLSMHSPLEITSKVDIFEAYNAYKVFIKEMD